MTDGQARKLTASILQSAGAEAIVFTLHAAAIMAENDMTEPDLQDALVLEQVKAAPRRTNADMWLTVEGINFAVHLATQGGEMVLVIDPWHCDVCDAGKPEAPRR